MLRYVCKSCRLAVTREDCSGLLLLIRRRHRDGLIGSFNPSGHLAERVRRPPPPYRRPTPYLHRARLSAVIIPIYLFILTRYIRTFKYIIRLRRGLWSSSPCPRRGVTSIGRRFFSSPTPWCISGYTADLGSFIFTILIYPAFQHALQAIDNTFIIIYICILLFLIRRRHDYCCSIYCNNILSFVYANSIILLYIVN